MFGTEESANDMFMKQKSHNNDHTWLKLIWICASDFAKPKNAKMYFLDFWSFVLVMRATSVYIWYYCTKRVDYGEK